MGWIRWPLAIARWLCAVGLVLLAAYLGLLALAIMGVYGSTSGPLRWIDALSGPVCIFFAALLISPLSKSFFKLGWLKAILIVLCLAWPAFNFSGVRAQVWKSWESSESEAGYHFLSYANAEFGIQCYPTSAAESLQVDVQKDTIPNAHWDSEPLSLRVGSHQFTLQQADGAEQTEYTANLQTDRAALQALATIQPGESIGVSVGAERTELPVGSAGETIRRFAANCPN